MNRLVIVESPTKAKTIGKFLGKGFTVESSYGHVRDLPKSALGIDVENGFEPHYVIPKTARARVTALKKLAAKADEVILATDEDREGEAIAWHLVQALALETNNEAREGAAPAAAKSAGKTKKKKTGRSISRIVFHEITASAIQDALAHPRTIDERLVDAQQARRVLDRLVGYKISPFLWKKVARGLSAGRVQSVALRLIADREGEIAKFKPEEYWTIAVALKSQKGEFEAWLQKINGEAVPKLGLPRETEAKQIAGALKEARYAISLLERSTTHKNPLPPFTTSTLQQTASKRIGFSAQKTMYVAQKLYENGRITYMRTDSVNIASEALDRAREWIAKHLGGDYSLPSPRRFKNSSRLAQEAHEAIRPTDPSFAPLDPKGLSGLEPDEKKLYDLIWRRFIASQLPQAIFDALRVEVEASAEGKARDRYTLAATGTTLTFDGFLKVWPMKFEEKELPALAKSDPLSFLRVTPAQHFTEPPPRYNEASLIKTLEKYGVGRPSTYAPTISVIQARNYVEKQQGRFIPTEIGALVNKVLTEHFAQIVDIQFTAKMEEELDSIAEGNERWRDVIKEFYDPFAVHLAKVYETVSSMKPADEKTDQVCEKCGKPMVIKFGRFGKFLACSGFPECKNTKKIAEPPVSTGIQCPECLASPDRKDNPGELVVRRVNRKGRARGKVFWGCSKYPACTHATWTDPTKPETS